MRISSIAALPNGLGQPMKALLPSMTSARGQAQPVQDHFTMRFGEATPRTHFVEFDVSALAPESRDTDLLRAFKARFPKGSQLVAAVDKDGPVLVYDVLFNNGQTLKISHNNKEATQLSLKKDLFLFQQNLYLNLGLLNGETDTAVTQWRSLFEKAIDHVGSKPAVALKEVAPYEIVHPCGFNIMGQVFTLLDPLFEGKGHPQIEAFTGNAHDVSVMQKRLVTPQFFKLFQQRHHTSADPLLDMMKQRLKAVDPKHLVPIFSEGMYERSAFQFLGSPVGQTVPESEDSHHHTET